MGFISASINISKKWRRLMVWFGVPVLKMDDNGWNWNSCVIEWDLKNLYFVCESSKRGLMLVALRKSKL